MAGGTSAGADDCAIPLADRIRLCCRRPYSLRVSCSRRFA